MEPSFVPCTLDGPFQWHVYIGGALADLPLLNKLANALNELGISTFMKYSKVHNDAAISQIISAGINGSQKCLLYITDYYLEDDYRTMEIQQILSKTKRFSTDMLILLEDDALKGGIPADLKSFAKTKFGGQMLEDKFTSLLADRIGTSPSAVLSVLPKENIGYGSAFGYFYGFLRLVLPNFRKRLFEDALGNDSDMQRNCVSKMLIIMPESCFCAIGLERAGLIEHTNKFVVRVANRAGNKQRDYKSSLYQIHDPENSQVYYFVGELATPLLTMFEMYDFQLAGMTRDQLYMERDAFYFALKAILSHPDNRDCNHQFRLLYWKDPPAQCPDISAYVDMENSENGGQLKETYATELHAFLLPVIREEVFITQQNISKGFGTLEHDSVSQRNRTFQTVTVPGHHPGAIYDSLFLNSYPMDRRVRGKCVIINIANFASERVHLTPRSGADADSSNLTDLFTQLRFQVEVHNDLTAQTMESVLLTMSLVDHSEYDAFVCCILTHGKLGVVYTSDGREVEILSITNFFTDANCPTLRGKPKLFFIQACQRGDDARDSHQGQVSNQQQYRTTGSVLQALDAPKSVESDIPREDPSNVETVAKEVQDLQEMCQGVGSISVLDHITSAEHPLDSGYLSVDAERFSPEPSENNVPMGIAVVLPAEPSSPEPQRNEVSLATASVSSVSGPVLMRDGNPPSKYRSTLIPGHPDFLMSYSTLPGSVSYRDTRTGSLYIQALVANLKSGHEIDRSLKMVTERVQTELFTRNQEDSANVRRQQQQQQQQQQPDRFQLPFHLTSGMNKLIYL